MYRIVGRPSVDVQGNAPFVLEVGGHFITDHTYCTDRQNLNNYLLLYTIDGLGSLQYEGACYDLDAGTLFFINCNHHQVYQTKGNSWEFIWVHFRAVPDGTYVDTLINRAGPVFHCAGNEVQNLMWEMLQLLEASLPHMVHDGFAKLSRLLAELYRQAEQSVQKPAVSDETMRIVKMIEQQFSSPLGLDTLAAAVNRSKYYLCHTFKHEMGISIYAYLTLFRVMRGKLLLRTTNLPVQDIAEQVGFGSAGNFIRAFSQYELVTPSRYRRQWQ